MTVERHDLGDRISTPAPSFPAPLVTYRDSAAKAQAVQTRRRVLVVDDYQDAAESLALILSLSGYDTLTAHDGPGAVATARFHLPHVAILDIGLPGMSGYQVAERFRADPALGGVVLIALTGWGSEEDKRRSRDAGFDFHLTKPVGSAEVIALLDRIQAGRLPT